MNKLVTWLPISLSIIIVLVNMSITYGQTSSELDTIKKDGVQIELKLEKIEENTEIKLELIKDKVNESKIEQAEMKIMLQQVLKKLEEE